MGKGTVDHATRQRLIDATVELMDRLPVEDIKVELVLRETGITRGSLYHFFDDFSELLEAAYLTRFSRRVHESAAAIRVIVDESGDQEEFLARLENVTQVTQARDRESLRFERARILAKAENNARFRASLGEVQQELTDALTDCFATAQNRGFLNHDFSPRAGAVLIQAYTLGKIIDDVVPNPVADADWDALITLIARRALA